VKDSSLLASRAEEIDVKLWIEAPLANRIRKTIITHGNERVDDYDWLRQKDAPEVLSHLEAENEYTDLILKPGAGFREDLYDEMLGRIKETDLSVPYRELGFYYYTRTEEGKQYPIHCRRKGSMEAPEETILDLNRLSEGEPYLSLGAYGLSDDGRYLAYSIDTSGFREYTLFVKDLAEDRMLPVRVERTGVMVWAGDGSLLYTAEDSTKRPYRLYRHRLGRAGPDELLYEEADERFRLGVWRSRSLDYVYLTSASHTTTEIRYARAERPGGAWPVVEPREPDHEYDVEHRGDRLYIRTNRGGRDFRLVSAPVEDPGSRNWVEEVPHRPEVLLEWFEVFQGHYVMLEREDGLPRLRVVDFETGADHVVELPERACSVTPGDNREYGTDVLRIYYESLVTPSSVYDYDMRTRERTLLKRTEVVGGYDPERFRSLRLHAKAADGTRIPITMVMRRDLPPGPAPMLLYGYGAYGIPLSLHFSSNRLSLLERGAVFALAHVRGGGELGKAWHDQGRMEHKPNTFSDFIACSEHLIAEGWTSSNRLVIEGGSAGGLLMGVVVNQRPELFKAVLSKVPFVDVLNTMLDASLPLTVGEYEEWGNPNEPEGYELIRSYCPYTNLRAGPYPTMLVRTSLNDSQVMYWEPAKYVAKLRALKTDRNPLLFQINLAAGHHGASGRYDSLREIAFEYAFVLQQLGLDA
jgi:oligopeptidase B